MCGFPLSCLRKRDELYWRPSSGDSLIRGLPPLRFLRQRDNWGLLCAHQNWRHGSHALFLRRGKLWTVRLVSEKTLNTLVAGKSLPLCFASEKTPDHHVAGNTFLSFFVSEETPGFLWREKLCLFCSVADKRPNSGLSGVRGLGCALVFWANKKGRAW